jgi:hypothetical protein
MQDTKNKVASRTAPFPCFAKKLYSILNDRLLQKPPLSNKDHGEKNETGNYLQPDKFENPSQKYSPAQFIFYERANNNTGVV